MQKDSLPTQDENITCARTESVVNEPGLVNISGYVKVFDPNSEEILVEARE